MTYYGLEKLKYIGQCALEHLIKKVDSTGHIFAILECPGCQDKGFCYKVARLVERELNLGG